MTMLVEFLLARLAEKAAMAERVIPYVPDGARIEVRLSREETLEDGSRQGTSETVAPYDPRHALAEVEAARQIISECGPVWERVRYRDSQAARALLHLASVYAAHPDYRQEWRP